MVTNTYTGAPRAGRSGFGAVQFATLVLWALAAACVVFWGLRLAGRSAGPAVPVAPAPAPAVDTAALAKALGAGIVAPAAAPVVATRLVLVGVLAGTASGGGAALIAIDGQPAKPYRVGAAVRDGLVLQSLARRQARLGPQVDGATTTTLDIPFKP
jgi:general secretion pathway protein C